MASGGEDPSVSAEDEDDYTGYFLEPTKDGTNIAERVAEANRKLYEEEESGTEDSERPKKVQFSERLVNFEPENYESDDFIESDATSAVSEEEIDKPDGSDDELDEGKRMRRPKSASHEPKENIPEEESAAEVPDPTPEEVAEEIEPNSQQMKVLLVMLPREQSSSCESVIGEEIPGEKAVSADRSENPKDDGEREDGNAECSQDRNPVLTQSNRNRTQKPCKMSKISPDLNYSRKDDGKKWMASRKPVLKCRKPKTKTENESTKGALRPRSSVDSNRTAEATAGDRPKTAPDRRSCCRSKTGLPRYNGLRSEYGLSAEQLQERKRKTFEIKQQRRAERIRKRQEEMKRRLENEERFIQWLDSKRQGSSGKRPTQVDTLPRSDVYIQAHAVYASHRGVPYSVDYGLSRKKTPRMFLFNKKLQRTIRLDRIFNDILPQAERSYYSYLGEDPKK